MIGMVPLVLLGELWDWSWSHHFWIRTFHLFSISILAIQTWFNLPCPLTIWENRLRQGRGELPFGDEGCFRQVLKDWIGFEASKFFFSRLYLAFFGFVIVLYFFI